MFPAWDADAAANPHAPPLAPQETEAIVEMPPASAEVEELLQRALRASVIGIVVCPPLLHFYSIYLLVRASSVTSRFSPAGTRRFYLALALNVIVGALAGALFLGFG